MARCAALQPRVHLPLQALMAHYREGDADEAPKESDGAAQQMTEELLWWTEALKKAREAAYVFRHRPLAE